MKKELKVGLAIAGSIVLFVALVTWGKGVSLTNNTKRVNILFPNASGLQVGDPVTVSGVKRGKVESIQLVGREANVIVSVDETLQLKADAAARLLMLEAISGKKIDLNLGSDAAGDFKNGQIIKGEFVADIPELVGFAGNAIDTLKDVVREVQRTFTSVNTVLADRQVQQDLRATVQNLRFITGDLVVVSRELREAHLKETLAKIDQTIQNTNALITELQPDLKATLKDGRRTVNDADSLILALNGLVAKLRDEKKSLAYKLLYDESFYRQVDSVVTRLDSVLKLGQDGGIKVKMKVF
jgi:phospholipid/cholesterol/gamma-HCH transport system substrate-binding protein